MGIATPGIFNFINRKSSDPKILIQRCLEEGKHCNDHFQSEALVEIKEVIVMMEGIESMFRRDRNITEKLFKRTYLIADNLKEALEKIKLLIGRDYNENEILIKNPENQGTVAEHAYIENNLIDSMSIMVVIRSKLSGKKRDQFEARIKSISTFNGKFKFLVQELRNIGPMPVHDDFYDDEGMEFLKTEIPKIDKKMKKIQELMLVSLLLDRIIDMVCNAKQTEKRMFITSLNRKGIRDYNRASSYFKVNVGGRERTLSCPHKAKFVNAITKLVDNWPRRWGTF